MSSTPPSSSSTSVAATPSSYYYEERLVVTATLGSLSSSSSSSSPLLPADDGTHASPRPTTMRGQKEPREEEKDRQQYGVRMESVLRHSSRNINDENDNDDLSSPAFDTLRVFQDIMNRHGAIRISVQFHHRADAAASSTSIGSSAREEIPSLPSDGSTWRLNGPSGVSVHVDFRHRGGDDDNDDVHSKRRRDNAMRNILPELHSYRILLAPVHGLGGSAASSLSSLMYPSFHRTSRLHARPFLIVPSPTSTSTHNNENTTGISSVVTYTYVLPTEASMASSEGWAAFLQLMPCGAHSDNDNSGAGLWSAASATEWSHFLLGTSDDAQRTAPTSPSSKNGGGEDPAPYGLAPQMPRRMWIEAKADPLSSSSSSTKTSSSTTPTLGSDTCPYSDQSGALQGVSLSAGVEYGVVGPSDGLPTLRSLLPRPSTRIRSKVNACPLADATRLVLINGTDSTTTRIVSYESGGSVPWSEPISDLFQKNEELDATKFREVVTKLPVGRTSASWHVAYTVERTAGQANRGILRTSLSSYDYSCSTLATVHHVLPRVVTPVWQSLHVQVHSMTSFPTEESSTILQWKDLDWTDGVHMDDDDGTIRWSFRHTLPPRTKLVAELEYEASFLNFEQFPPDPNRGYELPPVVAQLTTMACDSHGGTAYGGRGGSQPPFTATLYSDSPLIMAPVPDMSMPFNVISLTCTWYAFIIGSMIHLVLRKGSERIKFALHPELRPKPPIQRLKEKLKSRWARAAGKPKTEDSADGTPPSTAPSEPVQE